MHGFLKYYINYISFFVYQIHRNRPRGVLIDLPGPFLLSIMHFYFKEYSFSSPSNKNTGHLLYSWTISVSVISFVNVFTKQL